MSCQAAPIVGAAWRDDSAKFGSRVTYLGGPASASHSADCHPSSHNCASTCGGQESPVNGKSYDPRYCHAIDTGVGSDVAVGMAIVTARVRDPRVRYCIYRGVLYYGHYYRPPGPDGRTITTSASGHPTHVHTSFLPGTTFDVRPFYTDSALTATQKLYRWLWAFDQAGAKPFLGPGSERDRTKVRFINDVRRQFGLAENGRYDAELVAKVTAFRAFLKIPHRGPAGRINRRTWAWLIYGLFFGE